MIFNLFVKKNGNWKDDTLSGLTVALALALATGSLLFATRATEYADNPAFQVKLLLIIIGTGSVIAANWRHGLAQEGAPDHAARRAAVLSGTCWIGALVCGRLIAFVQP